ncbi:MAG: hypothetical protein ACI9LM_001796 [Alteromonadaceae bacterium]|jgi:hypothetical protein
MSLELNRCERLTSVNVFLTSAHHKSEVLNLWRRLTFINIVQTLALALIQINKEM